MNDSKCIKEQFQSKLSFETANSSFEGKLAILQ